MFPFTIVLILFIYGEFCKDLETRYIARLFQYTLSFSFLSQYFLSSDFNIALNYILPVLICFYTISISSSKLVKICFFSIIIFLSLLSYSLYTSDVFISEWVHNKSHRILREALVFSLGYLSYYNKADNCESINWIVVILIYIEYLTLGENFIWLHY